MVKAELGQKRTCQSCGAKFYDMNRTPILCPKCGATFDPETLLKLRRGKPPPAAAVAKPVPADEPEPAEVEDVADDEAEDEEEDEAVMEDTSELGQDSDDVEEVIDKSDEDGEGR
ncbi:MAG: TIGR02300 family protein [Alphaproteobacteria bacterium]|nr:TIGR02300 family protein [Alphaproteobacteria bacterium]